jgi:hypothetical protein
LKDPSHLRVQGWKWRVLFRCRECGFQFRSALIERPQLVFPCLITEPLEHQFKNLFRASINAGNLARQGSRFRSVLAPESVRFLRERSAALVERITLEEPRLHCPKDPRFDVMPADRARVRACATGGIVEASKCVTAR